jgi:hypothetical protein
MSFFHIILHGNTHSFKALLVLIKAMTEGNGENLKPFDSTIECFMARLDSSFEFLDFRRVTRLSDCDFVWLSFVAVVADSSLNSFRQFGSLFLSFFLPPRAVVMSCCAAGAGPLIQTSLLL